MRFRTDNEDKWFFRRYALQAGFGFNMGNKKPYSRIIRCCCEGNWEFYKKDSGSPRVRNKTSSKSGCMVKMKLSYEYDRYRQLDEAVIDYVNLVHNHPLLSPEEAKNHRSYKIGKSCCYKVVGDNAAYNAIDYLFWLCKQESSECERGKCK
jgi:hypothetical protein